MMNISNHFCSISLKLLISVVFYFLADITLPLTNVMYFVFILQVLIRHWKAAVLE